MFIQVIRGRVRDEEGIRDSMERWLKEQAPNADGWLGHTAGVSNGEFVAVVRFESEEAARRNSDRPEQGEWWNEASKNFEGDVQFYDCPDVETFDGGGSDDAGFVQVMIGRTNDVERMKQIDRSASGEMRTLRPDVIGGTLAFPGGGRFINTVYFTSEEEARKGEANEEFQRLMQQYGELMQDVEFIDLRDPWLASRQTNP